MKIGELAARAGCDVQTVRFYEREGLLDEPAREESGYRRYAERDLSRLSFIRLCRSLDIPLPEVRQLLAFSARPGKSCAQTNELLDRHIALVTQRMQALQELRHELLALRGTCDGDGRHGCVILESFLAAAQQSRPAHGTPP